MSDAENDEGADVEALFMQHKTTQPSFRHIARKAG
jgi:hypothetical protein